MQEKLEKRIFKCEIMKNLTSFCLTYVEPYQMFSNLFFVQSNTFLE